MKRWIVGSVTAVCILGVTSAQADNVLTGEEVTITAPRVQKQDISLSPEALPANVEVVTAQDVKDEQVNHYLDMLRQVPGISLETYGQGAIGDAIGMRGFFSDHGSQTAIYVDGVPLNWANSSHANGLTDISWITPEMVDRIEVIKGPFSALYGSFNLGGTINIITKKTDDSSQVNGYGGSYGTYRGAAELTKTFSNGVTPFFVEEGFHQDGYRENDDWTRVNSFNKVTLPAGDGSLSLRGGFVKQDWGAPGYISLQSVEQGVIPRNADVNPADGGDTRDYNFVMNYAPAKGDAGPQGTLYVTRENQDRFSTFGSGPQKWGLNDHINSGWRGLYNYAPLSSIALAVGTDGQYSDGRAATFQTADRQILSTLGDWDYHQWSGGVFSQLQMKPLAWSDATHAYSDWVKLVGGARYDMFDITLNNALVPSPSYSGTDRTSVVSPKGGIVISPLKTLDIFANKGIGFRQPSVEEISPNDPTQTQQPNFNLAPSKIRSWDVGFNQRLADNRVRLNFDYYQSQLDREIIVINDQPVNFDNTQRDGFEASGQVDITRKLRWMTAYAWVKARDLDVAENGGDQITSVPKSVLTNSVRWLEPLSETRYWVFDVGNEIYGRAPLNPAGSLVQPPITRWQGKVTYGQRPWEAFAGASFIPQRFASDIEIDGGSGYPFYYSWPVWQITAGLRYYFKI